jgi:hypothetical protein
LLDAAHALFWTGLLVLIVFITLGIVEMRRTLPLNPLSMFLLLYSLVLGAGAMGAAMTDWAGEYIPYGRAYVPIEDIALGYVLNLVGFLFFHWGLQALRPPPDVTFSEHGKLNLKVALAVFVAGCVSAYRPEFLKSFGLLTNLITFGAQAAILMVALRSPDDADMSRLKYWGMVLGGTSVLLFLLFLRSDSKSVPMLAMMPAGIAAMNDRKTRKYVPVAALVGVILFVAVLAPTINASRNMKNEYPDNAERMRAAFGRISVADSRGGTLDTSRETGHLLLKRFFEQNTAVGFIVGEVRKNGYQDGATMEYLKVVFIPRILWPDKPVMSRGYWFSAYVGIASSESEMSSSTAISPTGELYWNFGIPGVIVGMFFMGSLFGFLWRLSGPNILGRVEAMLTFSFATFYMNSLEGDFSGNSVVLIAVILMFGVITAVRRTGEKRSRTLAGLRSGITAKFGS